MQPEWRRESWPPDTSEIGSEEDWSKLDQGGPGGIFLVLICLRWWWGQASVKGKDFKDFDAAVKDVAWVLETLSSFKKLGPPSKRRRV